MVLQNICYTLIISEKSIFYNLIGGLKMGWSATKAACDTVENVLDTVQGKEKTDLLGREIPSNVWFNPNTNKWYTAEWTFTEFRDGHIAGQINQFDGCPTGQKRCMAYVVGSMYIEPNGRIKRWTGLPKGIKQTINQTI